MFSRFLLVLALALVPHLSYADVTLRLLTWEGYAPVEQREKFQRFIKEKYNENLTFEVTHISSPDDYFTGIRRNSIDIMVPSHHIIKDERYKLITEELLLPIDLKNIPNYSKIVPTLQKATYTTEKGKVYSVPAVHGPYGLAYNTAKIPQEPDSWNIFWDPRYKGRYTISSDYHEVNIYVAALAAGIDRNNISNVSKLSDPKVLQLLKGLIGNANNMWEGVDTADDLQNNDLGGAWGFSFPELEKRGQIWKMATPKEGTTGWVDGHAITRTLKDKPKYKRIAEEWINFTISEEYQLDVIVKGLGSAPVNLSVKSHLNADDIKRLHLDDPNFFANNRILLPTLSSRQRNFMKVLWNKASGKSGK